MHLHSNLCPHFCDLRGSQDHGAGESISFGQWENREKETSVPVPHQLENYFPPFCSSKVKFPLGAAKELKVTKKKKSWQFTMPWRVSQKVKWKWDCFHIRPLYLEDRIQTVWICSFTVHLGNLTKSCFFVFYFFPLKPKQYQKHFLQRTLTRQNSFFCHHWADVFKDSFLKISLTWSI